MSENYKVGKEVIHPVWKQGIIIEELPLGYVVFFPFLKEKRTVKKDYFISHYIEVYNHYLSLENGYVINARNGEAYLVDPSKVPVVQKEPEVKKQNKSAPETIEPIAPFVHTEKKEEEHFEIKEEYSELGWKHKAMIDNKKATFICEYCRHPNVRYIHVLIHKNGTIMKTGCRCAAKLTLNEESSQEYEKKFKEFQKKHLNSVIN